MPSIQAGLLDKTRIDVAPGGSDRGKYAALLSHTQGNILKGHGRDHSAHVFLRFTGEKLLVASRLQFLSSQVTSAGEQLDQTARFKAFKVPGGTFRTLALSAAGYAYLGLVPPARDGFFDVGMRRQAKALGDDPAQFDEPYRDGEIHAVLMMADDDRGFLLREVGAFLDQLRTGGWASAPAIEIGDVLRNKLDEGIEHFGYVDGRSQPLYLLGDVCDEVDARTGANIDRWDPSEPLRRVLVADPLTEVPDACGSFMVFRKLEQNVRAFKMQEQRLAAALNLDAEDVERAGAMVVGRFEDGTPLALSQVDGLVPARDNNFAYGDPLTNDRSGLKCPFQAHIRKVNPRGDTANGDANAEQERKRRITRRGIPYGERANKPDEDLTLGELPTRDVGLLFVCFQADIAEQFGFMQQAWANNESFVKGGVGLDPVIGQGVPKPVDQRWIAPYGEPRPAPALNCPAGGGVPANAAPTSFGFGGFVRCKGGEFFFAPSLPFLHTIESIVRTATPPPPPPAPVSPSPTPPYRPLA